MSEADQYDDEEPVWTVSTPSVALLNTPPDTNSTTVPLDTASSHGGSPEFSQPSVDEVPLDSSLKSIHTTRLEEYSTPTVSTTLLQHQEGSTASARPIHIHLPSTAGKGSTRIYLSPDESTLLHSIDHPTSPDFDAQLRAYRSRVSMWDTKQSSRLPSPNHFSSEGKSAPHHMALEEHHQGKDRRVEAQNDNDIVASKLQLGRKKTQRGGSERMRRVSTYMAGKAYKNKEDDVFNLVCTQLMSCLSKSRTLYSKPISTIEELFKAIDTQQNGYISTSDFHAASSRLDLGLQSEQVSAFFRYLDWTNTTRVTCGMLQYAVFQRDQIIAMNKMKDNFNSLLKHAKKLENQVDRLSAREEEARVALERQSSSQQKLRKDLGTSLTEQARAHALEIKDILAKAASEEKVLLMKVKHNQDLVRMAKNELSLSEMNHKKSMQKVKEESHETEELLRQQLKDMQYELGAQANQSAKRASELNEEQEKLIQARSALLAELRDAKSEIAQTKKLATSVEQRVEVLKEELRAQKEVANRDRDHSEEHTKILLEIHSNEKSKWATQLEDLNKELVAVKKNYNSSCEELAKQMELAQASAKEKGELTLQLSNLKEVEGHLISLEVEKKRYASDLRKSQETEQKLNAKLLSLEKNLDQYKIDLAVSNDTNVDLIESLSSATEKLGELGVSKGKILL